MIESLIPGLAVLLLLAPVGVAVWWGLLRLMDKAAGINFRYEMHQLDQPMAIYYGLRAVATAYLVASLFSRFV